MTSEFFYDSYAIIEYFNGNVLFLNYFKDYNGFTSLYNIMEVYYSVLREKGETKADEILNTLKTIVVYPDLNYVKESMKFRLEHKNKKLSYTDCIGYIMAKKLKLKFLTGDEGFRNLPGVEFVKS